MATKIRLARAGAKKQPFYKIVAADSRSPRDGKFIEKLGIFNPLLDEGNENRLVLNKERILHWLGVGATPTERVENFLVAAQIMKRNAHSQKVLDARIKVSTAAKKKKEAEAEAAKKAKEQEEKAAAAEAKKAEAEEEAAKKAKEQEEKAAAAEAEKAESESVATEAPAAE